MSNLLLVHRPYGQKVFLKGREDPHKGQRRLKKHLPEWVPFLLYST